MPLAFLRASTPDSEIPTDHAITAVLMQIAQQHKIKFIIGGSNIRTEAIMPSSWSQGIRDWKYIKSVHKQFGTVALKTFPHFTLLGFILSRTIKGLRWVDILNYINYNKAEAMKLLENELGWVYYGGKHYESIYTRFFQSYILPEKFNADKRRGHLSTLICSGEITRDQALVDLSKPLYPENLQLEDKEFVLKKFGLSYNEFEDIMRLPLRNISDYPAYENSWYLRILRLFYRFPRYIKYISSTH